MHVILVHGLAGWPETHWFPWLRQELEKRGITSQALKMPRPALPVCEQWVQTLTRAVKDPANTILIGHSLGCPTILYYLQQYRGEQQFLHAVLVAGFGRRFLNPRVSQLQQKLFHWLEDDLDFPRIRTKCRKFTCINSIDDPLVPYEEAVWLSKQLNAELVTERKAHFTSVAGRGTTRLPSALKAIMSDER